MSSPEEADHWFNHYDIADVVRVSDPDRVLYRTFGLEEASLTALLHPGVWWPWIRTSIVGGHGAGIAGPNWRQLTGVFVIYHGETLATLRHRNSAARPDYLALLQAVGRQSPVPGPRS